MKQRRADILREASDQATRRAERMLTMCSFVAAMPLALELDVTLRGTTLFVHRGDGDITKIEACRERLTLACSDNRGAHRRFLGLDGVTIRETETEGGSFEGRWSFTHAWDAIVRWVGET